MAKTLFGDETQVVSSVPTTVFGDIINPGVKDAVGVDELPRQQPVEAEVAFEKAGKIWDTSVEMQIPLDFVGGSFLANVSTQSKINKTKNKLQPLYDAALFTEVPFGLDPLQTFKEIPKGVARFLQQGLAGTLGGTIPEWIGDFITFGGESLDEFVKFGSKNKDQIYNPLAEAIIATGNSLSEEGRSQRAWWAYHAQTGWEAMDPHLKETDPVSYGVGRLTEGVTSSALSVLAIYLSGGASVAPELLNAGVQINRGLIALSTLSAAGGFEHAKDKGENFLWSTLHGLSDGIIEYAMETTFLENVKASSPLIVGGKEATEEFFTGMMQNTRAGILENESKGMSTFESTKKAVFDALKQSPWEIAAGFIGGYGVAKGRSLTQLTDKANATPIPTDAFVKPPVRPVQPAKEQLGIKVPPTAEKGLEIAKAPVTETAFQKVDRLDAEITKIRESDQKIPKGLLVERESARKELLKEGPTFAKVTAEKVGFAQPAEGKVVKTKIVPPSVIEKQALPKNKSVTPVEKAIIGVEPIDKVMESLRKAKEVQPITKAEQKAELKRRVGAAAGALKSNIKRGTPTDEAIFKSTGLLKGQLTDYEQRFESIEKDLTPEEKNSLYNKILTHPDLQYFEVVNTSTSLRKLLIGTALTDGDVKNIERVFGKTFSDITDERLEVGGVFEKALALWKAGLLTGIRTSGLNTLSNMTHSVTETAKDIPAVLVDKTAALFTGKRTLAFTIKGTKEGVIKGLKDGWTYLKTGHSERDIGKKLDYTKVNFGTGKFAKALQAYEETIFHLLGAEDQPFYYGAKARSIASQAIAQGKTKGLKGKDLDAFVGKKIKTPTDDMLTAAVHDAEVAVFQNRTALGDIAKSIQRTKVGQILVPFGRTPSAVATQIINYTPVGAVAEVAKQIGKGEFNQREFSQAFGRAAVGTGILFLGGLLLEADLLTLDRPRNEKERRLWELEGRKANSIKIDGKWRSIQVLGPAGNVLIIGGHFKNELSKEGSPTKAIVKALSGSAKSFSEQTFVQGVNKAVDALTSPERSFENWFSSMAGSVVPTIVADIARAQTEKEVRVDGAIQRIQSRVPGLRGKLPPKIDVFGQDLPRYGGNVLEVMIDPTRPAKIKNDVVVDELRRLADIELEVTPTLLGGKNGFDVLTEEENTELWRRAGELTYKTLQALVTSEGYANVTNDFAKSKMVEEVVRKTRAAARAEVAAIKLTQGFGVVELAESGLLSVEEIEAIKFFGGVK